MNFKLYKVYFKGFQKWRPFCFFKMFFCVFWMQLNVSLYCQSSIVKEFTTNKKEIELDTQGLDEIKIVNSETGEIKIKLFNESVSFFTIVTNDMEKSLKISFEQILNEGSTIFRKYITKRLNRVSAVINIPKDKIVSIFGTHIDIVSKDYKGDLNIYIDKGFINLQTIQKNVILKLFQGNIYCKAINYNIDISTKNGIIKVKEKQEASPYKKRNSSSKNKFSVLSIHANIFIEGN